MSRFDLAYCQFTRAHGPAMRRHFALLVVRYSPNPMVTPLSCLVYAERV